MGRSRTRKRASLGIIFWIAFILLILVVFLYTRQSMQDVMESTGLLDVVRTRLGLEDSDGESPGESDDAPPEPDVLDPGLQPDDSEPAQEEDAANRTPDDSTPDDNAPDDQTNDPEQEPPPEPDSQDPPREPAAEPEADPEPEPEQTPEMRTAQLYYITVSENGQVKPHGITRELPRSNSPLTANIRALLTGPSARELNNGLLSLIPDNTALLTASVSNRTAYLNFNEEFRYNSLGAEGLIAQLQQIVYTATEFSSVDRVQFLIDGQQVNYLGGDGVYIGQPLGRDSF